MARKRDVAKDALTREERLKSALKANLARRKAQARARAATTDNQGPEGSDEQKED